MADVTLDPKSSNPKELYGQGIRAFVLQDYDTAVRAFSKASELLALEHNSDTHDSLGDVYLYYGKALLGLSQRESGPLGDGVLKNVEEESETEDVGEEVEGEEEKKADDAKVDENGDASKVGNEKAEEGTEDSAKVDDSKTEDAKPEEGSTESNEKPEEQKDDAEDGNEEAIEEGTSAEKKDGETEDDLSDLQVAWEVLELAKRIFTDRGDDGKKNLAETYIVLGEISLESGNFSSAIEDIVEGLKIQKTLFGDDSRIIAETYFKLGGAYSTNGQMDEAIESFNFALEYLQNKINSLKKDEEQKEANADEIEELDNLIPEIQEKITDMKNLKIEIANKMTAASVDETAPKVNGNSEASSSKQVNNISHLVKRKRKEDDAQEDNPAKRPSP